MDSRVGQTITNVLYAMQYFSDRERESTEKVEGSDEESCQRKANKLSVRTNGDVKSLKNEPESRDFPENSSVKRPAEHNGLPKGMFSFIYIIFECEVSKLSRYIYIYIYSLFSTRSILSYETSVNR